MSEVKVNEEAPWHARNVKIDIKIEPIEENDELRNFNHIGPESTKNAVPGKEEDAPRSCELFKPYNMPGESQIGNASKKDLEFEVEANTNNCGVVKKRPAQIALLPQRSNKHVCRHCKKQFTWKFKLTKHMMVHKQKNELAEDSDGGEREEAETSERTQVTLEPLTNEIDAETNFNNEECIPNIECEVNLVEGDSSLLQSSSLKTNTVLSEIKKIQCKICNKEFNQTGNLTIHMRIHTGETPYGCPFCEKKFRASGDLTRHLRIHTGETPYECTVCGKKFTQRGPLTTHMRIHTGETPYGCPICNKKFNRNGTLTKHMRMHTGETPYECTVCTMKFKDSSKLRKHMRLHTEKIP